MSSALAADVDQDSSIDVLMTSGGRVSARRWDDSIIWQSDLLGVGGAIEVTDLNGDGEQDVIVAGYPAFVAVLRARDGATEWRSAPGLTGPIPGAIRVLDLNGDGRHDIYLADAGCSTPGTMGDLAYAFTFGTGFGSGTSDPQTILWQLERGRDYVCGEADSFGDFNGDGVPELAAFAINTMWLFDGRTGRKIDSGSAERQGGYDVGFAVPYGVMTIAVRDVDGDGRDDLLGFTNNHYEPPLNSRAVWRMSWDGSAPQGQRFATRWASHVAVGGGEHLFATTSDADLDGDGRVEIVTSVSPPMGSPTTRIFDGTSGRILQSISNSVILGTLPLPGVNRSVLFTQSDTDLVGFIFENFDAVPTPAFRIANARPVATAARPSATTQSAGAQIATVPLGTAGVIRLPLVVGASAQVWDVGRSGATHVGDIPLGSAEVVAAWPQGDVAAPGPGLLVGRSDGILVVTDSRGAALNLGSETVALNGIRTAGFYAQPGPTVDGPLAAQFGNGIEEVIATTSQRTIVRLDPRGATIAQPPHRVWEWRNAFSPALVDVSNDSTPEVIAFLRETDLLGRRRRLEARRADGGAAWTTVVAADDEDLSFDVLPLDGATGRRLVVASSNRDTPTTSMMILNAMGGVASRSDAVSSSGSHGFPVRFDSADRPGTFAVDLNGPVRLFDPSAQLLSSTPLLFVGQPMSWTRGGVARLLAPSIFGLNSISRNGTDWQIQWQRSDVRTNPFFGGARVDCPSGPRFALPRLASNQLVILDALTGMTVVEFALGHGLAFADTPPPGVISGVLSDAVASPALDGTRPAIVVGSSDGFLYAIDACGGRLLWSYEFGWPVGQSIFADVDGDGADELLVEAADGYLTALDTFVFDAPTEVLDTDPPHGFDNVDVDELCGDGLYLRWRSVPGATGYEWAIFTVRGDAITHSADDPRNPFVVVDAGTTTARWSEGIVPGSRYLAAVRAIGAGGRSAETLSDGVRYVGTCVVPDAGVDASDVATDASVDGSQTDAVSDAGDAAQPDVCRTARCLLLEGRAGPIGNCQCDSQVGSRRIDWRACVTLILTAAAGVRSRRRRVPNRSPRQA